MTHTTIDLAATLRAIEILTEARHAQGACNVITGILYRAARRLEDQAKRALTGGDDDRA